MGYVDEDGPLTPEEIAEEFLDRIEDDAESALEEFGLETAEGGGSADSAGSAGDDDDLVPQSVISSLHCQLPLPHAGAPGIRVSGMPGRYSHGVCGQGRMKRSIVE